MEVDLRILFKNDNLTNQEINILRTEMEVCSGAIGDALSYNSGKSSRFYIDLILSAKL